MRSKKPFHSWHIVMMKTLTLLRNRRFGLPTGIGIETSSACNRRCHYCPQSENPKKQEHIKDEVWNAFVFRLREAKWKGVVSLTQYNEPAFAHDLSPRIREIVALGCYPLLFSNGDRPEAIEAWIEAGARRIIVTEHPPYSWQWEAKIYPLARKYRRIINLKKLDQIIWRTNPVRVNDEVIKTCRWNHAMQVSVKGHVVLCCLDYECKTSFGDIVKRPILDIWFDPEFKNARELSAAGIPGHEMCKTCIDWKKPAPVIHSNNPEIHAILNRKDE